MKYFVLTLSIISGFSMAQAQTATPTQINTATSTEMETEANYNNSRSNRSTVAAPDVNICDGYTCEDGTCVAEASACNEASLVEGDWNSARSNKPGSAAAVDICDGFTCDDGSCVAEASACDEASLVEGDWNATRSNKPVSAAAVDVCDGFTCDDGRCVAEASACNDPVLLEANYNNTRSNKAGIAAPDINVCDGFTCADGSCVATEDLCPEADAAAANYNNTRSNRSTIAAPAEAEVPLEVENEPVEPLDLDSDDDGLLDETEPSAQTAGREIDKASPLLMDTLTRDEDSDDDGLADRVEAEVQLELENEPIDALDDDGDGFGEPSNRAQSHNSSRSNRTEGVAPDVNVCDGFTCDDGSCVATEDLCLEADAAAANYNNTRSNRSVIAAPTEAEVQLELENEPVDPLEDDSDGDELDDGAERANYNNSRSNKSTVRNTGDTDSDGDGLDDLTERANYNNSRSNRANVVDGGGDCDDDDACVYPGASVANIVQTAQAAATEVNIDANAEVETQETDGETVSVVAGTEAKKFLGLFGQTLNVKVKLNAEGELIEIDRPWYAFLSW